MQRTIIRTVVLLPFYLSITLAALPAHALLGWNEHKIEKWNEKTYYLLGLVANGIGTTLCSSNEQAVAPDVLLSDYGPQLARWFGDSYVFVAATMARHTDGRYVYDLACQDAASGAHVQVPILFEYTRDGVLESLTFDRDLAPLPGFGIKRGVPVAIETVVRALRMSARAVRADAGGMEVKKLKTKVSACARSRCSTCRSEHACPGSPASTSRSRQSAGRYTVKALGCTCDLQPQYASRSFCLPHGYGARSSALRR
jgi:hypothetical protein